MEEEEPLVGYSSILEYVIQSPGRQVASQVQPANISLMPEYSLQIYFIHHSALAIKGCIGQFIPHLGSHCMNSLPEILS